MHIFNGVTDQITVFLPRLVLAATILSVFWLVALLVERLAVIMGNKLRLQRNVILLFGRTSEAFLIIAGVIWALASLGVNISALIASLGLTGFALGFALRDALSNVLAGTLILIYKPFKCGERISITGFEGEVIEIDLRYTSLKADGKRILIPNSNIFTNPVIVFSK